MSSVYFLLGSMIMSALIVWIYDTFWNGNND